MRVSTWNVRWADPADHAGPIIRKAIAAQDADVIVLTEGRADLLPEGGHIIDAGTEWGYPAVVPESRQVIMWSRNPWTDANQTGPEGMPSGRFVSAVTETPLGELRVIGVAVPWSDEHVRGGREDSKRWEQHSRYLHALATVTQPPGDMSVVAGDFNQKIPRFKQPINVVEQLDEALANYSIPSAAVEFPQLMDHIAHSGDLRLVGQPSLIDHMIEGVRVSDHTGVTVELMI